MSWKPELVQISIAVVCRTRMDLVIFRFSEPPCIILWTLRDLGIRAGVQVVG